MGPDSTLCNRSPSLGPSGRPHSETTGVSTGSPRGGDHSVLRYCSGDFREGKVSVSLVQSPSPPPNGSYSPFPLNLDRETEDLGPGKKEKKFLDVY